MSYITLQSDKAALLADSVLNRVEASRAKKHAKNVERRIQNYNAGLLVRWGWMKPLTQDRAQRDYEASASSEYFGDHWVAEGIGVKAETLAYEVLSASRLAQHVSLSLEDASTLQNWAWEADLKTIFGETDYRGNPLCMTKTG